ncbi:MAG: DUF1599 domain-containing protein [Prevotella sp.]|nr:DUF1599 domain-containing protein [Prevotella sp.]
MANTEKQFKYVIERSKDLFAKKLKDYGATWRIMRPQSVTDQLLIKAKRIRNIEESGVNLVGDSIASEFTAIVNYCFVGLIQLELGYADDIDIDNSLALEMYDKYACQTGELLFAKNHDYGEAWRIMRISSYTDLILVKLFRIKQIESNDGKTLVSEGVASNYMDILNYAVFGLIKLDFPED